MAHSIQKFRSKTEVINDFDLLIIVGFALKIVQQNSQFDELQELVMRWYDSLNGYGPGVIDLELEHLEQTPKTAVKLVELFAAVVTNISQYGETIPANVLNEQSSLLGVKFSDYRAKSVEESVEKLRSLISS